jgi:hypothetical protein
MYQPANRLRVISIRFTIISVRRPVVPAARRPALPARPRPRPALLASARPSGSGLRRLAGGVLAAVAVLLFATVPVWVAGRVVDSGIWDLRRHLATPPDLSSPALPLVLGSIVVLAAMSSSSRPRDCDRW